VTWSLLHAIAGMPVASGFGAEVLLHTPLSEVLVDDQLEHVSFLLNRFRTQIT